VIRVQDSEFQLVPMNLLEFDDRHEILSTGRVITHTAIISIRIGIVRVPGAIVEENPLPDHHLVASL
jgi:hypothetical protein